MEGAGLPEPNCCQPGRSPAAVPGVAPPVTARLAPACGPGVARQLAGRPNSLAARPVLASGVAMFVGRLTPARLVPAAPALPAASGLCVWTICWTAVACWANGVGVAGAVRLLKKRSPFPAALGSDPRFTGRLTGCRLCRFGTTGRVPFTTPACRSVLASIARGLRGMRPLAKSWVETVVMAPRTRSLLSAA